MLGDVMALMCVGFNSSVGILSVGTCQGQRIPKPPSQKFQFLSRNSVRWDLLDTRRIVIDAYGFNSSVGILSVGTGAQLYYSDDRWEFQFLSRNSVRWDIEVTR